jgi:uncharacterized protein (UPF0548 family)
MTANITDDTIISVCTVLPATLAALASWRSSRTVGAKVETHNSTVVDNHQEVLTKIAEVANKLDEHIQATTSAHI